MADNRIDLSNLLHSVMIECGDNDNVYFQPPESMRLEYPCIIYTLHTMTSDYADDAPYHKTVTFDVTYITRNPDSQVPVKLLSLPQFAFDRYYPFENLHHYTYTTTSTLKEDSNG